MNVDLPAPLGPSNPVIPAGTVTVTSFRPDTWPYHFDRCSVVMIIPSTTRPDDAAGLTSPALRRLPRGASRDHLDAAHLALEDPDRRGDQHEDDHDGGRERNGARALNPEDSIRDDTHRVTGRNGRPRI